MCHVSSPSCCYSCCRHFGKCQTCCSGHFGWQDTLRWLSSPSMPLFCDTIMLLWQRWPIMSVNKNCEQKEKKKRKKKKNYLLKTHPHLEVLLPFSFVCINYPYTFISRVMIIERYIYLRKPLHRAIEGGCCLHGQIKWKKKTLYLCLCLRLLLSFTFVEVVTYL